MDIDPTKNTIVFEIKRLWKKEPFVEQSPTRADDGIQMAWRAVQSKTNARPSQVRQVYSEWEPSQNDAAFLTRTFPGAKISYTFARPAEDGWEQALAEASRTMQASMEKQIVSQAQEQREKGAMTLFPVLRTYDANDLFAEIIVHRAIGADLAVYLAHTGMTPRGTIGIDYVLRQNVDTSEEAVNALFETALQNLRSGLKVNAAEGEGNKVFTFIHPSDMASSALCLPDFHAQVSSWLGQEEVFVAFTNPGTLFATLPNSKIADKLRENVMRSEYWGAVALTPACYLMNGSEIRQIAARPAPSKE